MIDDAANPRADDEIDPALADLTAEIIGRIECGEAVKSGDYAQAYPGLAEDIDRLLPTVNTLVALGKTYARRGRSGRKPIDSPSAMTDPEPGKFDDRTSSR